MIYGYKPRITRHHCAVVGIVKTPRGIYLSDDITAPGNPVGILIHLNYRGSDFAPYFLVDEDNDVYVCRYNFDEHAGQSSIPHIVIDFGRRTVWMEVNVAEPVYSDDIEAVLKAAAEFANAT